VVHRLDLDYHFVVLDRLEINTRMLPRPDGGVIEYFRHMSE
jgi:hypothetical protein